MEAIGPSEGGAVVGVGCGTVPSMGGGVVWLKQPGDSAPIGGDRSSMSMLAAVDADGVEVSNSSQERVDIKFAK